MTPQQWVGLGVRLFAVWLAVTGLPYLLSIPLVLSAQHVDWGTGMAYAVGSGYVIAAALLWFFPMSVAHRLVPRTRFEGQLQTSRSELAQVGLCLLGVWLLSKYAPALVSFVFRAFLVAGEASVFGSMDAEQKLDLAILVVETVVALALVLRAESIAGVLLAERPASA